MRGVAFSTGIKDSGGLVTDAVHSSGDLAEKPTSSTVGVVTCTSPRSIRSAHSAASDDIPSRAYADLSISQRDTDVTTTRRA